MRPIDRIRSIPVRPAATLLAAALVLAACGGGAAGAGAPSDGPAPVSGPTAAGGASPDSIAEALRRATLPASPLQAQFTWQLDEAGSRFSGRGVARYDAPRRFRLDLFGPRGETYLAAALVDGTPRVPAGLAQRFPFPSPALLWGAVGVVAPPAGARLQSASASGGETTLRYALGEDVLEYRARADRLFSVRRLRGGGVQESIDLEHSDAGTPRTARYRDWPAFRTLNLSLEQSTDVAAFPDDTWTPPGT